MGNMSYCRFENTNRDLNDCQGALEELIADGRGEDVLSRDELYAAKQLVITCNAIVSLVAETAGLNSIDDLEDRYIEEVLDQANEEARASKDRERQLAQEEEGR